MCLDFAPSEWSSGTRLVAIALADRVNGDTLECFPSIADLVRRTGISERAVQRHLRILEDDGTITRQGQRFVAGKPSSNVWKWNRMFPVDKQVANPVDKHGRGASSGTLGVPAVAPLL